MILCNFHVVISCVGESVVSESTLKGGVSTSGVHDTSVDRGEEEGEEEGEETSTTADTEHSEAATQETR